MRRSDREVSNTYEIEEIIRSCRVCRIAMNTVDGIYIIPMNFGYAYEGESFVFYFHGACEGRKIDALKKIPYAAPITTAFKYRLNSLYSSFDSGSGQDITTRSCPAYPL